MSERCPYCHQEILDNATRCSHCAGVIRRARMPIGLRLVIAGVAGVFGLVVAGPAGPAIFALLAFGLASITIGMKAK